MSPQLGTFPTFAIHGKSPITCDMTVSIQKTPCRRRGRYELPNAQTKAMSLSDPCVASFVPYLVKSQPFFAPPPTTTTQTNLGKCSSLSSYHVEGLLACGSQSSNQVVAPCLLTIPFIVWLPAVQLMTNKIIHIALDIWP